MKEKIAKFDSVKKNFKILHDKKTHLNQSKKTNWKNLFTHHIIIQGLIPLLYKEFL